MKTFIAIILLMEVIHKPQMPNNLSKNDYLHNPMFSKMMSKNRFYLILRFLHFNDNEDPLYDVNDENRDRLRKIRPLINIIQERC